MEQGNPLPLSTDTHHSKSPNQDTPDGSRSNLNCSLVATTTLVLHAPAISGRQDKVTPSSTSDHTGRREHPSSGPRVSPLDNVVDFPSITEVIEKARKPATKLLYKYKWQNFLKFTEERKLQSSPLALSTFLLYLWHLFDLGLSKSTLKVYTSAIVAFQPHGSESSR